LSDATAAERQRRKRQRDAADGWASVRVRVPADKVDELKAFAASLGEPSSPVLPGQPALPLSFAKTHNDSQDF
jgi:hypothetical protein